jgi:pimeloyl-ACP methyl ester carboxylesterase
MGTNLDAVEAGGDSDRIWVNYFRLMGGRIRELRLTPSGDPPPPPPTIRTSGIHSGTYLPLLLELDTRWHTRPFGYDWRCGVDASTDALAADLRAWTGGEPAHLVVHSMGGLVARRLIQRHPALWRSLQDPGGASGGRLVMLGTPNRGSFAIVLALSGEEKLVKRLALLDLTQNRDELLRILNTFLGSYHVLPSPLVDLGDDHARLFDPASWGSLPVLNTPLALGESFQRDLEPVIDPQRLVYVAGYGQPTPCAVHIAQPGRFRYDSTDLGDGRVPHTLGLLAGVVTFYVLEKHGDLPKNDDVLRATHELLLSGTTRVLADRLPARRARARIVPYSPARREAVTPEAKRLAKRLRAGARRATAAQGEAAERLVALALADYLGTPAGRASRQPGRLAGRTTKAATRGRRAVTRRRGGEKKGNKKKSRPHRWGGGSRRKP